MLRHSLASLLLVALPAFPQIASPTQAASSPDSSEVVALESNLLDLNAAGNCDELGNLLLPEFKAVSQTITDREKTIDVCKKLHINCTVTHSAINQQQVNILSPDVASLVYKTGIVTICGSKKANITINATSVWVRVDGAWKLHLHTERAIAGFAVQSQ